MSSRLAHKYLWITRECATTLNFIVKHLGLVSIKFVYVGLCNVALVFPSRRGATRPNIGRLYECSVLGLALASTMNQPTLGRKMIPRN